MNERWLASLHPSDFGELAVRSMKPTSARHGSHFSALRRASRSPESSRKYVAGDPLQYLDWRAFARTDQLLVREYRPEAEASVYIGLDLTPTMEWPDALLKSELATISKAELAQRVALNLAYVHRSQGDTVKVFYFHKVGSRQSGVWKPSDRGEIFEQHRELGSQPRCPVFLDSTDHVGGVQEAMQTAPKADIVYWLGDGLGMVDLDQVLSLGRRSCFFHVLSWFELNVDWVKSEISYFDDQRPSHEYLGNRLKTQAFQEGVNAWLHHADQHAKDSGVDYQCLTERTSIYDYQAHLGWFLNRALAI